MNYITLIQVYVRADNRTLRKTMDSFTKGIKEAYKQYIEDKEGENFKEYAEDFIYSFVCYDC